MIPVANTSLGKREAMAVYDTVKYGWVSKGKKVDEFEEAFKEYVGANNAIAVNNGTSALHLALAVLDVGPGDEVIVPALTFISTANVVLYQGATLVLCDVDSNTLNVTPKLIAKQITPRTKAVITVDMCGMPVDYDPIIKLCKQHNLHLIADSAEAMGATYKNQKVGSIAPIHTFSFFPNKNMTTGEGGMITCKDSEIAKKIRILLNQGQEGRYNHTHLGYNYRMTDIQASIGIEQLKKVDLVVAAKQTISEKYDEHFRKSRALKTQTTPPYVTQHSWYLYTLFLKDETLRDSAVKRLTDVGIETRLSFPPIHTQPYYAKRFGYEPDDFPNAYDSWRRLINIPIWRGLRAKQYKVINEIKKAI